MAVDIRRLQLAMRVKVSTSHPRAETGKDRPEGKLQGRGVVRAATCASTVVPWWGGGAIPSEGR